jgi:hypothetical protein
MIVERRTTRRGHKWKRYGEGRLYLIAGSVGAFVIVSSLLSAQDRKAFSASVATSDAGVTAERLSGSTEVQPKAVPVHTRTRGS